MRLVDITSVPDWYGDNQFIRKGFRPPKPSFTYCLWSSVSNLHNESGNIFSHLIGALIFAILWYRSTSLTIYQNFGLIDKFIFGSFFIGIIICLMMSTLFHAFRCHSRRVFKLFAKLDFCGITLLIAVSFIPWIYYGFAHSPTQRNLYLSSTAFLFIACCVISMFDKFSEPELRKIRVFVFLLNGCSAIFPCTHLYLQLYTFGPTGAHLALKSILMLILMAIFYVAGALLYMFKIPECLFPGRFDLWLHSHQLFHALVIVAGLTYFYSMSLMAEARLNHLAHHQSDFAYLVNE